MSRGTAPNPAPQAAAGRDPTDLIPRSVTGRDPRPGPMSDRNGRAGLTEEEPRFRIPARSLPPGKIEPKPILADTDSGLTLAAGRSCSSFTIVWHNKPCALSVLQIRH
jgi:hypothetical protein